MKKTHQFVSDVQQNPKPKTQEEIVATLEGGGLKETPIDMSSFYLRTQFFLSLETRCHSETNLHYSVSPFAEANV